METELNITVEELAELLARCYEKPLRPTEITMEQLRAEATRMLAAEKLEAQAKAGVELAQAVLNREIHSDLLYQEHLFNLAQKVLAQSEAK